MIKACMRTSFFIFKDDKMEIKDIFRTSQPIELESLQPISYATETGEMVIDFVHHPMRTVLVMDKEHFQIMWKQGQSLHSFVADYIANEDTDTFHVFTFHDNHSIVFNVVASDADDAWLKVQVKQPGAALIAVTQGNLSFPMMSPKPEIINLD